MEISQVIGAKGELGAVLIRKDGTRVDYGIVASDHLGKLVVWLKRFVRTLRRRFSTVVAFALLLGLIEAGRLPWQAAPLFGLVTTAGVNYMASDFASGGATPTISGMKYHASGTGTTAAAIGDTALQTDSGVARVIGTPTNPSANVYKSVATMAYISTLAITEWGLFSALTSGTLWDHRVFSAINVVSGDSIQFSYSLTIAAGGS